MPVLQRADRADVLIRNADVSVGGLDISYDSLLRIYMGRTLYLTGATYHNDGIIYINQADGTLLADLKAMVDVTIDGTGEIVLDKYWEPWPVSSLTTLNGATITNGPDHSIGGNGWVLASLNNLGTVAADMNGYPLRVTEQDKANAGTFVARNGGSLYIFDQLLTQTPQGQLLADGNQVWLQGGASIVGGNLETVNGGEILLQQLDQYHAPNSLTDVTITAGSNIQVGDISNPLYLRGSTLVNNGTITVNHADGTTVSTIDADSNVTISGTGDILLNKYHRYELANIRTTNGSTLINGHEHTIHGIGHIQGIIENQGLITADVPGGTLHLLQDDKTNAFTMQAENGGILLLDGFALTQTSAGQLIADSGTVNVQNGASIALGALASKNNGAIAVYGGNAGVVTLTDVSIAPGCEVHIEGQTYPAETWLRLENSLINDGTITIDYSNNNGKAHLEIPNDVIIAGSGSIALNRWHQYELATIQTSPGALLTNEVGHTIRGIGHIRASIDNYGTLGTDTPGHRLDLYPGTNGITNHGILQIAASSEIRLFDAGLFTQVEGMSVIDGTLYLSGGGLNVTGGVLTGTGIISGSVSNAGASCEPGLSVGTLTINGDYTQTAAGVYRAEASGRVAGESDTLAVAGHATLDGTLVFDAIDGFEPQPGDRFQIMTYASHTGQFAEFDLPPLPSRRYTWRVVYGANVLAIEYIDRLEQGGNGSHRTPDGAQRIGG